MDHIFDLFAARDGKTVQYCDFIDWALEQTSEAGQKSSADSLENRSVMTEKSGCGRAENTVKSRQSLAPKVLNAPTAPPAREGPPRK